MRGFLKFVVLLLLNFSFFTSTAFADQGDRQSRQQNRKENRAERQDSRQERRVKRKERRSERRDGVRRAELHHKPPTLAVALSASRQADRFSA